MARASRVVLVSLNGNHFADRLRQRNILEIVTVRNTVQCLKRVVAGRGEFDAVLLDLSSMAKRIDLSPLRTIASKYPHIGTFVTSASPPISNGSTKREAARIGLPYLAHDRAKTELLAFTQIHKLEKSRDNERIYLRGLLDLSKSLLAATSEVEIAKETHHCLVNLIPNIDCFYLALKDEKREQLRLHLILEGDKIIRKRLKMSVDQSNWGLAGKIIARCKPFYSGDLSRYPRRPLIHFGSTKPARTYFGLPLMSGNSLIGVISVQSYKPDAFDTQEENLVKGIANQAALALDRVLQRVWQESHRVPSLVEMCEKMHAVRTAMELGQTLDRMVTDLWKLFNLDICSLGLLDQRKTKLDIISERGVGKKLSRRLKDLPRDIVKRVLAGELVEIANIERRPKLKQTLVRKDLRSLVVLPLRARNQTLGVINMGSRGSIRLSAEHKRRLRVLGEQAGVAIQNVHTHQATQTSARQLEQLGQMTLKMAKQPSRKALLQALPRMAQKLLDSSGAAVYLKSEKEGTVVLEAYHGLDLPLNRRENNKALVREVLREEQPIAIENYRHWPKRRRELDSLNLTAAVGAPIVAGGKILGAIIVYTDELQAVFTPSEQKLLFDFARHAGEAIETIGQEAEDEAVSEIAAMLTSELEYPKLLEKVREALCKRLGYESFTLLACDADELKVAVEDVYPAERIRTIMVGEGITGWVAKHCKPLIVHNVRNDKRYIRGLGVGSEIAVPVIVGKRAIAVLDVENRRENAFGEQDLRILERVAAALATAIVNARQIEKTLTFQSLVGMAAETSDLKGFLPSFAGEMLKACPATFCHVMLVARNERNVLRVRAHSVMRTKGLDWNPRQDEYCNLLCEPALARQIRKAESIFFSQDQQNTRFIRKYARQLKLKQKLKSALLIPLRGNDNGLIGLCILGEMRRGSRSAFTPSNIQFATALAAQAAVAIEKERSNELARERAEAMVELHQVGNAITSSLNLNEVLQRIVDAGQRVLRSEVTSIFIRRREGFLRLEASSNSSRIRLLQPVEIKIQKGHGLTGHVASVGRLFNRYGDALVNHPAVIKKGPQKHLASGYCTSMMALPLRRRRGARAELVGLIKVENKMDQAGQVIRSRGFDKTDVVVLKTLASYAETALQNVRDYDLAHSSQEVARVVNSTLDFDNVLNLVLRELRGRVPFDTSTLQLLQGGALKVVACEGFKEAQKKKVLQLVFPLTDKYPNSKVMRTRRPFIVSDIRTSIYKHFWEEADVYCSGEIQSWLGVPLLLGREVIGMLSIESKQSHSYTNLHSDLLEASSSHIAAALVNARIQKTTQSMLDIMLDLTEKLDLDAVLKKLVKDAVDKEGIIGADIADIYLYDPDRERVEERPVTAGLPSNRQRRALKGCRTSRSLLHAVIRSNEPRIVKDVTRDRLLYRDFARRNNIKSVGVFPLRVGNESVGVMFLNYLRPFNFDKTEELMTMITRKAALLIQHTRKFKVVTERFEFAKKAAASLYALSAWAHSARQINYDIGANLHALKLSLRNVTRESERNLNYLRKLSAEMNRLPTPPADVDQIDSVDLALTFERVTKRHDSAIKRRQIRIQSRLDNLPPVAANKWLLEQALNHLTSNAIDALKDRGKITVSGELKENHIYILFRDNGTGIPPRLLRALFTRRVVGQKGHGSGFGLLLSKIYVNACDGELTLDQTGKSGTTFAISLPIADRQNTKITGPS